MHADHWTRPCRGLVGGCPGGANLNPSCVCRHSMAVLRDPSEGGTMGPLACGHHGHALHACVRLSLYCMLQGFTDMCKRIPALEVMRFLNAYYSRLDAMLDIYKVRARPRPAPQRSASVHARMQRTHASVPLAMAWSVSWRWGRGDVGCCRDGASWQALRCSLCTSAGPATSRQAGRTAARSGTRGMCSVGSDPTSASTSTGPRATCPHAPNHTVRDGAYAACRLLLAVTALWSRRSTRSRPSAIAVSTPAVLFCTHQIHCHLFKTAVQT